MVGGVMADLQGGKFGSGFASAFITKYANVNDILGTSSNLAGARIALASIIGGTVSELTGGKFANGAITAAMMQAVNGETEAEAHRIAKESALREYGGLRERLIERIESTPEGAVKMSAGELSIIVKATYYRTLDMPIQQALAGEWDQPSVIGDFSLFDTFLHEPLFTARQFNIEGTVAWGGHINYLAVGMLAERYGPNMSMSLPGMVAFHNANQIYEGFGWRNLADIMPGTRWALFGAKQFHDAQ
ncbi:MAG: hypothetical protein EOO68_28150 [Moraxellaceae bacterium]|nr:MAG: hypothetical protein EOO68_28150 [Moraxellaceae bacterium]